MILSEYQTITLQCGQATIKVHRPVLSEAEAAKRQQQAQEALAAGLKSYLKRKERT